MTRQALSTVEQNFHERMHAAQIHGLWELAYTAVDGERVYMPRAISS